MPEPAARMTALEAGEVDMIYVPHPDGIAGLKDKGFKLLQGPTPHVWYFAFNLRDKNYQDVRVRRAINMAIDREGMAKQLLKGTAVAARGLQAPCCPSYDPTFKDYSYDPAQAKKLIAEAGIPQRLRDDVADVGGRQRPAHPGADGRVDPARPRQGRHQDEAAYLRMDHLYRVLDQGHGRPVEQGR
jgi:peptide/nickel transport system substrate-binding protein